MNNNSNTTVATLSNWSSCCSAVLILAKKNYHCYKSFSFANLAPAFLYRKKSLLFKYRENVLNPAGILSYWSIGVTLNSHSTQEKCTAFQDTSPKAGNPHRQQSFDSWGMSQYFWYHGVLCLVWILSVWGSHLQSTWKRNTAQLLGHHRHRTNDPARERRGEKSPWALKQARKERKQWILSPSKCENTRNKQHLVLPFFFNHHQLSRVHVVAEWSTASLALALPIFHCSVKWYIHFGEGIVQSLCQLKQHYVQLLLGGKGEQWNHQHSLKMFTQVHNIQTNVFSLEDFHPKSKYLIWVLKETMWPAKSTYSRAEKTKGLGILRLEKTALRLHSWTEMYCLFGLCLQFWV